MPNRLAAETSPYLLQHAHNPVDWYPWGPEALQRAKAEGKPILLSIGYSACHWCHVMERESFEDPQVAAYMNENFVCIKVDREERPDLDRIYMDALQAITGQGGWPLNIFLTPDTKPFYGGTYFPVRQMHGRPSWSQAMQWVRTVYDQEREKFDLQAENLTEHIAKLDRQYTNNIDPEGDLVVTDEDIEKMWLALRKNFDTQYGGFGGAPKFPHPMDLSLLLQLYYYTGNREAADHALFSLEQMIRGGIYDQLGGGFSRYSVDEQWLAPHFEKMLYDNALLVEVMAQAYKLSGREIFKEAIEQTLDFVEREMTSPEGGFYAALDADSEGEEGKYYVWQEQEVDELLGDNADLFKKYYDITPGGNWEHKNILRRLHTPEAFAAQQGITVEYLKEKMTAGRKVLLAARQKRVRPGLDDKVILCWNGLMTAAYIRAYEALGTEKYLQAARKNIDFIFANMYKEQGKHATLYHTWKGKATITAFLDDGNALATALFDLYQATFDLSFAELFMKITHHMTRQHSLEGGIFCIYTHSDQEDVLFRKSDKYDSVTPSGNSMLALSKQRIGTIKGDARYNYGAELMLHYLKDSIIKYPTSFANWASALLTFRYGFSEIAVTGPNYRELATKVNARYMPDRLLMASGTEQPNYPLLKDRVSHTDTRIYLCRNYTCSAPVGTVEEMLQQSPYSYYLPK